MKTSLAIIAVVVAVSACTTKFTDRRQIISIESSLPGATAETIESSVTIPIETKLQALPGVILIESTSSAESSYIEVFFSAREDKDILQQVRSAVEAAASSLPKSTSTPKVELRETARPR